VKFNLNLRNFPWFPFIVVIFIAFLALIMLYSMNAGSFYPWCINQLCRLLIGIFVVLLVIALPTRIWRRYAYESYVICLALLASVSIIGKISMGAQRWLNLYFFNFQPSELMRIAMILALAKYFSRLGIDMARKNISLVIPFFLMAIPVWLVSLQPDLGTAVLLLCTFISILFACGVPFWKFVVIFLGLLGIAPIIWSMLHKYQQDRILVFLDPTRDPNGAGYHVIQSQIALGSGGFWGKGFLNGSQCQLNFLPEKQTDFVFAALGEEFGFVGCVGVIVMYAMLLIYNLGVAMRARERFDQILVVGINAMLFFYIFINIAMVCGLLPVVGIPLPFFSYGGSALVVLLLCQGIIFAIDIDRKSRAGLKM
jgi:rod shape determining protein RodA